jgi:hypothetical protein
MNGHVAAYLLLPVVLIVFVPLFLFLINPRVFRQKRWQVVTREPGERFLGHPQPVKNEAEKDFVFALISQAVYQRKPDAKDVKAGECVDADKILNSLGWRQWKTFPDAEEQAKFATVHLRTEIWSNESQQSVVVAFAGTVFTNWKDWKANLRWFLSPADRNDEYTMIVTTFGDAFVKQYLTRVPKPEWNFLPKAHLYSTGHSLGGGLSQQFAYSLPINKDVPRVEHVYAFDPSPVTGFFSVEKSLRNTNKCGLKIDRIYERGEIVAILRSFTNFFAPPKAVNPMIRQVRYNLFSAWTAVAKHSIVRLACRLYLEATKDPSKACEPSDPYGNSRKSGTDGTVLNSSSPVA